MSDQLVIRTTKIICTPFGEYINGDDESEMTPERLEGIARRFRLHHRNVPVYLIVGEGYSQGHVFALDTAGPADGWVEGLRTDRDGNLVGDLKLHGEAARYISEDLVRGASIGTVVGKNPDDTEQGEVLQHLVLTNEGFDQNLNLAATQKMGSERVACYFTALPSKEAEMADPEKKDEELTDDEKEKQALQDEIEELKAKLAAFEEEEKKPDAAMNEKVEDLTRDLKESIQRNSRLAAVNTNLTADVKRFQKSPEHALALKTIKAQERKLKAGDIRRFMAIGVSKGQFNASLAGEPEATWDAKSDEVVLGWFEGSKFQGRMENLEFALETMPERAFNKRPHRSGQPPTDEAGKVTLTDAEKALIVKNKQDPDTAVAALGCRDLTEYKAMLAARKEA